MGKLFLPYSSPFSTKSNMLDKDIFKLNFKRLRLAKTTSVLFFYKIFTSKSQYAAWR